MSGKYFSDAKGNPPQARFPFTNSQGKEELHARVQKALWGTGRIGQSGVSIAGFAFLLLFTFSLVGRVSAQTSGDISGHVADATGAVIPGANITLTNVGTGGVRTTVSTGSGDYTFTAVPVGVYKVSATHAGFKTSSSNNVTLQIQQSMRLDFTLEVGAATESIEVSATAALLQAENATIGTVVENRAVNELPLNGRNFLGLVALSSNVNTLSPAAGQAQGRLGGDRANQAIAVGGQRIMFDYYTLDGVNNTDPDFNTYVALPSIDGIQEFKVQTGVYSAEFGHEASQVNVVSKSGTNTYHGSMFEFIRNNEVDAKPYYFPYQTTPLTVYPFKWNNYGFELDGPIRIPHVYNGRDKFFFMVDDEWRKIRQSGQGNAVVPSAAMLQGNFQGYVDKNGNPVTIYDPTTGDANGLGKTAFPNNTIPSGRINPISAKILSMLYASSPNGPSYNSSGTVVNNYAFGTTSPQNRQSLTVRGDYIQSQRSQYAFRYSSGKEDIIATGFKGAGSKIVTNYYQYMGSNTLTLTPHIVNEARFGYSHFFNSLGLLSAYTTDVVTSVGIPGLNGGPASTWGIPLFTFGPGQSSMKNLWSNFGDTQDGPYVVTDPMWQIVDNIGWVRGKHSLRFGFEYNRQTFDQLGNQFSRGQFDFWANATAYVTQVNGKNVLTQGDPLADFLLGEVGVSTVAVSVANAHYVRNVEAAYVDDTYKVTPKLTISAGFRYELTPPWVDTLGDQFNIKIPVMPKRGDTTFPQSQWPYFVRQGNCTNAYQGLSILWTVSRTNTSPTVPAPVCSNGTLPDALLDTAKLNIAPRLGIAYSPTANLVIRTGFGIFYSQDVGNAYFDMARNIAGRVTFTSDSSKPLGTPDLNWNNSVPGGGGAIALIPPPYGLANAISHKTTYSEQFLLNVQQQVGQNWSFELGYMGALHRHLYGFLNANTATPYGYIGNGAQTSLASRTPFLNYGVVQLVHDGGAGNYNAFSAKATRRFSSGFNVISSYTYSKSLDNTSGIRNQGNGLLFPQDSQCIACEYGRSDFDVRHRIVGSILYQLPIGPDRLVQVHGLMNALIGGWQLGGIFTHQTGIPATPQVGTDNSNINMGNGNFDRPNATGTSPYLSGSARTLSKWVNSAAYSKPAGGFFGNVQRGSYSGPSFTNLDASLHKNLPMPYNEKHQLSIRFEMFNSLNHPNWGNPNLNITSSIFGRISSAGSLRQLQLAAKYQF